MNGKQLKNSILQWAILGKLVPQDPNDEPASVLLEKIRQEKERLIKEKKIKRDKNASIIYRGEDNSYYEKILATGEVKCIDEEIPFEVPNGWEWTRMGYIGDWGAGATPSKSNPDYYGGNVLWLRTGELNNSVVYDSEIKVTKKALQECSLRMNRIGDVLIAMYGATIGKVAIVGKELTTNQACCACTPFGIYNYFLFFFLMGSQIDFIKKGEGGAQPNISREKLVSHLMPIPPLTEQYRIVEKIQYLLPLVEKYSDVQILQDKLNSEIKDKLRKSILQEAIQGKLVPQIAEEGTAQELLEQIKIEKQKLVKEGKLKKSALNDSVIFKGDDNRYYEKIGKKIVCIEDEVPFEIPNSWVWVRLGAIVDFSKSQTISSSILDMDSWILDLEDIEKDSGRLLQKKRMKDLLSKSDKHLFYKGNVLYSKLRPYLNKVIVADEDGACTTEILAFDFGHIYNKYAQAYLMSPFFVDYANSDSYGIKMPRLGSKKGNNALFPIPPLREQQRIVEKIEQLMQLLK